MEAAQGAEEENRRGGGVGSPRFKIGLIGAGNMGEALAGAILRARLRRPGEILASDPLEARRRLIAERLGISVSDDNRSVFDASGVVLLAVKPQQMPEVLACLADSPGYRVGRRKLVVSIAAGFPLRRIEAVLYAPLTTADRRRLPIVRAMPNTPAWVGAGITGISPNAACGEKDLRLAARVLGTAGRVLEVPEDRLDAVTAVSGSGPAYVYYFLEAVIEGGLSIGLTPGEAFRLAVSTFAGAVALLEKTGEPPERLRRQVTSPGGTTEAALRVFDETGVKAHIAAGIRAAEARARELSR